MKTNISSKTLDSIRAEFKNFPKSSTDSTVEYDTGKLIKIIREKEIKEVLNVSEEDFAIADQIDIGLGDVVRDLVFEKDLEKSMEECHAFNRRIEDETIGDLYIFSRQGILSVRSLYEYKKQNWQKAIDYTVECITLNDYLVEKGVHSLNLRIFEQNKNISRVLMRAGRFEEGYTLVHNLLDYLLAGKNQGLYGSIFNHPEFWNQLPVIRETYAYEMFCMLVEDMIVFNLENKSEFFPRDWYHNVDFEVDNINRQLIYNYMYINNQMHEGNFDEFTDAFTYYFSEEFSVYYEIFKISLLIELCKIVTNSNYEQKDQFLCEILQFLEDNIVISENLKTKVFDTYYPKVAITN